MTSFESYQFDTFVKCIRMHFMQSCKMFDILMHFSFVISFGNEIKRDTQFHTFQPYTDASIGSIEIKNRKLNFD